MKKILICDDQEDIRDVLEASLELEYDCEIQLACDGAEGIDFLSKQKFDIILCDMNMPKKSGLDVFNFNKDRDNTPFILLSGNDESKRLESLKAANQLNDLLGKPWESDELFSICEKIFKD